MSELSHINAKGEATMVDVAGKLPTSRTAIAEGYIFMSPETLRLIEAGDAPKGDVLATARIAGIMAAKKTSELIPLCHPLALSKVAVDFGLVPRAELRARRGDGQGAGADRRRDGGADGRLGELPHALRHAQSQG